MKYTKPHVLATVPATSAIQNHTGSHLKLNPNFMDGDPIRESTTAAYDADE